MLTKKDEVLVRMGVLHECFWCAGTGVEQFVYNGDVMICLSCGGKGYVDKRNGPESRT